MTERTIVARYTRGLILAVFTGLLFSGVVGTVQAQACGDIVAPQAWFEVVGNEIERRPIIDCNNPFPNTTTPPNPYQLSIEGQSVSEGGQVSIPKEGTRNITFTGEPSQMFVNLWIFKHEGGDLVYQDESPSEMTDADFLSYLDQYFSDQADRDFFRSVFLAEDKGQYLYNPETGEDILDSNGNSLSQRYYEFIDAARSNYVPTVPAIGVGTYTFVWREYDLILGQRTWRDTLREWFIPTAYAQEYLANTYSVTVNLVEAQEGASSVLFLPGIMGSRLYEESFELGCGLDAGEVERWFSNKTCQQLRLLTDVQGNSINDIYTTTDEDSVIGQVAIQKLYSTFFAQLSQWKDEEKIKDYALVPYDWRLRLDELLTAKADPDTGEIRLNPGGSVQDGYLYKTLQKLSGDSYNNGQVTIVAHSNGGLLAKAFLAKLEEINDPLLEKVDNLILVASPQVGTPDTIMGMLHGTEIGPAGAVITKQTSRTLLNTMPFAFHLLPNESYFDGPGVSVDSPVIYFEPGGVTTQWINNFGQSITDAATLERFMSTDSGRARPVVDDLGTPEVVSTYLFDNYTGTMNTILNSWTPPPTMQVKELAGVGIETVSGVEYFTDRECVNRNPLLFFKCTAYTSKLGMRATTTFDGDATVVTPSALALSESNSNVKRWWLDLAKYNKQNFDRKHKDIFEVEDVRNFVANTIFENNSSSYTYLSNTPAILPNEKRLTFTLHSPLDLVVTDSRGVISSSTETIEGGSYRRFGEVQYISIPDSGIPATVKLAGEATGSFTLEIATFEGTNLAERYSYSAIPSSTTTVATIVVDSDLPLDTVPLVVDYDGNGSPDITYDTKGEVVPVVTYNTLIEEINALPIRTLFKKFLLENAKVAQVYDTKSQTNIKFKKLELVALGVLKQQVLLYERNKILTAKQREELLKLTNELSK